jgi:hypothetical protein
VRKLRIKEVKFLLKVTKLTGMKPIPCQTQIIHFSFRQSGLNSRSLFPTSHVLHSQLPHLQNWDNNNFPSRTIVKDEYKDTCTFMFIAALFTIAKLWKQPRCPTTHEWIKKMWYLYTMEFYSATKKNEILSFAGKWMELENIILNKVSQAQKAKNRMFSLICRL